MLMPDTNLLILRCQIKCVLDVTYKKHPFNWCVERVQISKGRLLSFSAFLVRQWFFNSIGQPVGGTGCFL